MTTPTASSVQTDDNDVQATLLWAQREAQRFVHNFLGYEWFFEWDHAKARFGACHFGPKKITLSRHLTPTVTRGNVRNTLLHEIAHALVGPKHGHDRIWAAKAREIGLADPQRASTAGVVKYNWLLVCVDCGEIAARRVRKTDLSRYSHNGCERKPGRGKLLWRHV